MLKQNDDDAKGFFDRLADKELTEEKDAGYTNLISYYLTDLTSAARDLQQTPGMTFEMFTSYMEQREEKLRLALGSLIRIILKEVREECLAPTTSFLTK